jgi:hypothetical protein
MKRVGITDSRWRNQHANPTDSFSNCHGFDFTSGPLPDNSQPKMSNSKEQIINLSLASQGPRLLLALNCEVSGAENIDETHQATFSC